MFWRMDTATGKARAVPGGAMKTALYILAGAVLSGVSYLLWLYVTLCGGRNPFC